MHDWMPYSRKNKQLFVVYNEFDVIMKERDRILKILFLWCIFETNRELFFDSLVIFIVSLLLFPKILNF